METIRNLTLLGIAVRSLLSIVLGGLIGMERGMKNRPAGMRTYMLVSLGACLVMMTNQYVFQAFATGDPTRMAAQVVSGIGFLGAGTIIVTSRYQIKGLTTAAGLWTAAGIGLAVGIGFYEAAVLCAVLVFIVLSVLHELDDRMRRRTSQLEVYMELTPHVPLGKFIRFARENSISISNLQVETDSAPGEDRVAFVATLKSMTKQNHDDVIRTIRTMDGLAYVEEL